MKGRMNLIIVIQWLMADFVSIIALVVIPLCLTTFPCVNPLNIFNDFPLNFNIIWISTGLNSTSSDYGADNYIRLQQAHSRFPIELTELVGQFAGGFQDMTLVVIGCENLGQINDSIIKVIQKKAAESRNSWSPILAITLPGKIYKEMKNNLKETWARKFRLDSQVYFVAWDNCEPSSRTVITAVTEIYSISNATFSREIYENFKCANKSLEFFTNILRTKVGRRLDFGKARIIGITLDDPDYEALTKYKRSDETVEFEGGFEVLEFWYLRDALNFTEVAAKWPTYLRLAPNGSLTGLAIPINFGLADVVIGYHLFLEHRLTAPNGITFLHPTFYTQMQVFFTQPAPSSIRDIFINAFNYNIWLTLGATWITLVSVILLFSCVKQSISGDYFHSSDFTLSDEVWIWAVGAICQKGFHVSPLSASMRVIFLVGITTGLLIYTAYSAALVSILSEEVIPVKTFTDLLSDEFNIFSDDRIPAAVDAVKSLETAGIIPTLKGNAGRNIEISPVIPKLFKSKIAIVTLSDSFYQIALQRNHDPDHLCEKISKVLFHRRPSLATMFVKRGSPLREYFNCKISLMTERGILKRLRSHYIHATSVQCYKAGRKLQPLAIKDLFTAYIILSLGLIGSLSIAIFERLRAFRIKKSQETVKSMDHNIFRSVDNFLPTDTNNVTGIRKVPHSGVGQIHTAD